MDDTNIIDFFNTILSTNLNTTDISNNEPHENMDISRNHLINLLLGTNRLIPRQSNNLTNVLNSSLREQNKYVNVISEEGKEQIKIIKYKNNEQSIKSCPIMFVDFEEDEEIAQLPCKHIFNKDAIYQWLEEESNKCPVCRYELQHKEKKIDTEQTIIRHPYGPSNRRIGFHQFLNRYYEAQEERMVQEAIEKSLLDNDTMDNVD